MWETKYNKLKELCDEHFINPMVQEFAGANAECRYCGAVEQRDGKEAHSFDCPVIKYKNILNT